MKRYFLSLGLVFSTGCGLLKGQVDLGNVSTSDALSVGTDLYKAATLSDDEVVQMATGVARHYDQHSKIAPASSPYSKRLAKLVARHREEDGLKLNYKVYIDPEINAFSLADGTVRVNTGLMDKMSDDELLFVIGHEIGHVKNGHSKARLQRAYAASAATKAAASGLASGAGSSVAVAVGGEILADLATDVVKAQFSQGDETESDEYGVRFISKSGHTADAAVQALLKLGEDDGRSEGVGAALNRLTSSHPEPLARAEHIRELLPGLPMPGAVQVAAKTDPKLPADSAGEVPAPPAKTVDDVFSEDEAKQPPVAQVAHQKAAVVAPKVRYHSGSWMIQVGSFADKGRALQVMDSLSQASHVARIQEFDLRGGAMHRVLVGPYNSREEARAHMTDLLHAGSIDRGAFVRSASAEL
jgi:putative metalloprotease